jgi:hypothetical protein
VQSKNDEHPGPCKIQAIYKAPDAPFTMQGLVTAREKPPAQEQGETGAKTGEKQ